MWSVKIKIILNKNQNKEKKPYLLFDFIFRDWGSKTYLITMQHAGVSAAKVAKTNGISFRTPSNIKKTITPLIQPRRTKAL
uniref:Uncharacterized protein n=1 Tax=Lepeophtheirus salmonis TaxID=72036 RepID=A0A0K2TYE6_LEPSM